MNCLDAVSKPATMTATLATLLLLSACEKPPEEEAVTESATLALPQAPTECVRGPILPSDSGSVTVLKQSGRYRCELVYLQTGVELRPDPTAQRPDPQLPIAMDRQGRYFSASASQTGTLLAWSAEGTFLQQVARQGDGPGEFPSSYVFPFVARDGTIMVRTVGKWIHFSEDFQLLREVKTSFPGSWISTAVLDDGRILSGDSRTAPKNRYFHIFDPATSAIFSFGSGMTPREDSLRVNSNTRPFAYAGGDKFWAAPTQEAGHGYTLELWSTKGHLIRTIRREVSWFPPGADLPGPEVAVPAGTLGPMSESGERMPAPRSVKRPPSRIINVDVDERGLIYVYVSVVTDRWRYIADNKERLERYDEMIPEYVEVIDPDAGEVIASSGPRSVRAGVNHFPRSNFAYSSSEDANGLVTFKIVKLSLMPN